MELLLDTHTFLWFAGGDERLSAPAKEAISDATNPAYVSTASVWEMAIKVNIGKLGLPGSLEELMREQVRENAFDILRSELPHYEAYVHLPLHHRDPFDRMIIAQGKVEGMRIVGKDAAFEQYDVKTLW